MKPTVGGGDESLTLRHPSKTKRSPAFGPAIFIQRRSDSSVQTRRNHAGRVRIVGSKRETEEHREPVVRAVGWSIDPPHDLDPAPQTARSAWSGRKTRGDRVPCGFNQSTQQPRRTLAMVTYLRGSGEASSSSHR